jgi:hypothetical protein
MGGNAMMTWFDYGYDDAMNNGFYPPLSATPSERKEYAKGWTIGNLDYWRYGGEATK